MSKAREPVKNQSFCNWFLFFHVFLRDVVMYKSQSSLSFFLWCTQTNKQTNSRTCYCHLEEELQGEASLLCGTSKLHHDGGNTSVSCAVSMTPLKAKSHTSGSVSWRAREGVGGKLGYRAILAQLMALCRKRYSLAKLVSRFQVVGLNLLLVEFFLINLLGRGGGGGFCLPVLLYIYIYICSQGLCPRRSQFVCLVIFSVLILSFPSPPLLAWAFVFPFPLVGWLFKPIVKVGPFLLLVARVRPS